MYGTILQQLALMLESLQHHPLRSLLLYIDFGTLHFSLCFLLKPCCFYRVCLQACILRKCLKTGQSLSPDNLPELRIILHDTLLASENLTPPFMRALARQGWQTEKIVVEAHRRRARW
jgi:hypothetical protein